MLSFLLEAEQGKQWARDFLPTDLQGATKSLRARTLVDDQHRKGATSSMCKLSLGNKNKLLFFFSSRQSCCLTESKTEHYFINCHQLLHCWRKKEKSQPLRKHQHGVPTHMYMHPNSTNLFLKQD